MKKKNYFTLINHQKEYMVQFHIPDSVEVANQTTQVSKGNTRINVEVQPSIEKLTNFFKEA